MAVPGNGLERDAQQVLGYLNYSAGATDLPFLAALNRIGTAVAQEMAARELTAPFHEGLAKFLRAQLAQLHGSSPAFSNSDQAEAVLALVFDHALAKYREFHRDLLFHQNDDTLFNAFFIGRVCEAVLRQGGPWSEVDRIIPAAVTQLNDYIGHRPVPALESQKIEPYVHEWVRPVPLFIRGAGVSHGPYQEVVTRALELLEQTDEAIQRDAYFDPQLLEELAFDPRAYDFDHPANKRPNYHFGQWDPHRIDNQGRYRRFVVQQVSLGALLARLEEETDLPREEVQLEGAAVLAGIVLMASGVSGRGPETHDSSVTLSSLLPRIAAYRDAFYERLISRLDGAHAERLRKEAKEKRQPFGGARQELNAQLARRRAAQLEHVHLAKLFARMGYPEAAAKQADVVPAASARMLCRIDCLLTAGHQALDARERTAAADVLPEILALLKRAIECGATIDPWNILGFDAQYSLFPAIENSVRDHRADELVSLMERIFALFSRTWSEAAASDDQPLSLRVSTQFQAAATWWHKFAAHEVQTVGTPSSVETYQAAAHVAESLRLWHQGGAAAGDVKFWAPHAARFDSPKAYALVVEALLERHDFVASLALLVSWLSNAGRIGLDQGDSSFCKLAESWLRLWRLSVSEPGSESKSSPYGSHEPWALVRRFFDCLEANAEEYGETPSFELGEMPADLEDEEDEESDDADEESAAAGSDGEAEDQAADDEDDEEEDRFDSAYEDMVYRDSTGDGVESDTLDSGGTSDEELEVEGKRIGQRLDFLACLAQLWKLAAYWPMPHTAAAAAEARAAERADDLRRWLARARAYQKSLAHLLAAVEELPLAPTSNEIEALVEYDRCRMVKESLLERILETCVEMAEAARLLAAAGLSTGATSPALAQEIGALADDDRAAVRVLAALLKRDAEAVRSEWPALLEAFQDQTLLYVPLAKGGRSTAMVDVRARQQVIHELLRWLPRCGLLSETCQLLEAAREMERAQPIGPGAVTEFDDLFEAGYKSLVTSLVDAAENWLPPTAKGKRKKKSEQHEVDLVGCLESLTETLLSSWLTHSRTLRLSVLEKVREEKPWRELVQFIEQYGADLFTQKFFNISNVRAILNQGVDSWLEQLVAESHDDDPPALFAQLDQAIPRAKAVEHITLVLESILENYGEYRDYNNTTTQSDRGELLYMFLDFLRLRMAYDRVSWNLKPVILAHEILVRRGQHEAAQLWRRALAERIREEADRYLSRLVKLQKEYAMRMPTVADRLNERFIRPMLIDRVRALVEPAIREAARAGTHLAFEQLEFETASLAEEPSGVGLDVPNWLLALEEEVERARRPVQQRDDRDLDPVLPPVRLSHEEILRQLETWQKKDSA